MPKLVHDITIDYDKIVADKETFSPHLSESEFVAKVTNIVTWLLEIDGLKVNTQNFEPDFTGEWRKAFDNRELGQINHARDYAKNHSDAGVPGHSQYLLIKKMADYIAQMQGAINVMQGNNKDKPNVLR